MKKTYISPTVLEVELNTRSHMMSVSYGDNNNSINSMSIDRTNSGGDMLSKGVSDVDVWDEEW